MASPRLTKPLSCEGCHLYQAGIGFVPAAGPATARVRFIAEALQEAIDGTT